MADIHGFVLERAPLRALFHAQGAMTRSQNRILLFYAADVITAAASYLSPDTHGDSCKSAAALAPLKDNPYTLHSLMGFEINAILSAALDVLADIKTANLGADNAALQNLVSITHDYIAMARRIQNPDYRPSLVHMSEISPALAASFITAYTRHFIGSHNALTANINSNPLTQAQENTAQKNTAQKNTAKKNTIRGNTEHNTRRLYEITEAESDNIALLLDDLSRYADYCHSLSQRFINSDEYDPALYRLHSLFQSCAIFDWRQYNTTSPHQDSRQNAAPKDHAAILPFKLAKG